jgi:hypothetical protein
MNIEIFRSELYSRPVSLLSIATYGCLLAMHGITSVSFAADQPTQAARGEAATLVKSEAHGGTNHQLEGAWDITITTTPNPPFSIPFRILRTVTPTGVVDSYAFPPITPTKPTGVPLVNTSGHGNWGILDHGLYSVTVKYFQLNPSATNVLDSVGTVRENIRIAPDGNSYSSVFETTITLANGTQITNQGRTEATRMVVEPLLYLP